MIYNIKKAGLKDLCDACGIDGGWQASLKSIIFSLKTIMFLPFVVILSMKIIGFDADW